MTNKSSLYLKMLITLSLITFISTALLVGVDRLTYNTIAEVNLKKEITALQEVLPKFDSNPMDNKIKVSVDNDTLILYPVYLQSNLVGVAVKTFTKAGFGGRIEIMVGFTAEGTIYNTSVISHKETPGLGDKIDQKKHKFSTVFNGINPKYRNSSANNKNDEDFAVSGATVGKQEGLEKITLKKDGGDIDAITASTISSRAFCDAVQRAYLCFMSEKNKFNKI